MCAGCRYNAATLGVIFDKQINHQDFYRGHPREVASIAVGPLGKFAATGELGKRPVRTRTLRGTCVRL